MSTVTTKPAQTNLLRQALKANGLFSAASGALLAIGAEPLAAFMGIDAPWVLMALGVALVLFAADLWYVATRETINSTVAAVIIALDVGWVIGSYLIVITGWPALTTGGFWSVAIVADIVAVFAVVQYIGLRRQ